MNAAAIPFLLAALFPPVQAGVIVAYDSSVDAYAEALEGLRTGMGSMALRVVDLHAPAGMEDLAKAMAARETRLVIAVGSGALKEVAARKPASPVIAGMVLHGTDAASTAGRVDLEVGLAAQLGAVRVLLPRFARVGILRNPQRCRYSAETLHTMARKEGYTPVVVDCDGPAQLLKAMSSFKGRVDFVLCFPDPDFYNAVTVKPLVLASLESRLPLVGFSPAFVRAGALAGVYPDYREAGRQIADLALRTLRGDERPGDENPAKVRVAVNQRVARLLGIEFRTAPFPVEVFR